MSDPQRFWLSGCMGMLALGLANHFLTWDSPPISGPGYAPPVVTFALTPSVPSHPDDPFALLGDIVAQRHGIFVREGHSSSAAVWGAVVPLLLIAGAGYLALGSRSRGGPMRASLGAVLAARTWFPGGGR